MEPNKFYLSEENRAQLRHLRQEYKRSAEEISVEMDYSKAWLSQVERGIVRSIKKNDLVQLLSLYTGYSREKIESDGILHNFIEYSFAVPSAQTDNQLHQEVSDISTTFMKFLNNIPEEEQRYRLTYIHFLLRCMQQYPGITSLFLENFFPLYDILEYYNELPADQMFTNLTKMMARLSDFMKSELDIAEALTENTDPS